jgi:cell division protein FtsB
MTRYNSNYGSHDQLQDLRKANMALHRENDGLKIRIITLLSKIDQLSDELAYYEALLQ